MPTMQVMVLGLRGIPQVQGGVETHAEHLYPLLVALGCQVEVISRSPYHTLGDGGQWKGVLVRRLWAPRRSGLEAFAHSFVGVLYAAFKRPDVLHIHAIGPAFMTPLARFCGLRVVVTHHGPDYDREKWGRIGRRVLQAGERFGMQFASDRIVISDVIRQLVLRKYRRQSVVIPNGVVVPKLPETKTTLDRYGLSPGRYILQVSRFVPEKRQIDLIRAFKDADLPGWKLVLVGALAEPGTYAQEVQSYAENAPDVVLTGFQSGLALQELYAHAGVFVLPSSHEGLPIALLEALSYGLRVLASDIPANLEIGLPESQYFRLGDIAALAQRLEHIASTDPEPGYRARVRGWIEERYDWERIARQTLSVYQGVVGSSDTSPDA